MLKDLLPNFQAFFESGAFDVVEDYHGIHAEVYDSIRDNIESEVEFYRSLIPSQSARVMELGCGTGCLSIPLTKFCDKFLAIDSSADMLAIFKKKIPSAIFPDSLEIREGDFLDFTKTNNGPFDLILIPYNSAVHITSRKEQNKLFHKAANSLKPKGHMVVDVWIPKIRKGGPFHRCSLIQDKSEMWVMYSIEKFPTAAKRIVNMLLIPLNSPRKAVLTIFSEYVYTRSEIRHLFHKSRLKVKRLPFEHPVVRGQKQRLVYIGSKP